MFPSAIESSELRHDRGALALLLLQVPPHQLPEHALEGLLDVGAVETANFNVIAVGNRESELVAFLGECVSF